MTAGSTETSHDKAQGQPVRLRLWLNAFIPARMEGVEPVPTGPHVGKTMLPSPGPLDAWFLTDQRGFSDDPTAHSRMHSALELELPSCRIVAEAHCCDDTVQVDPETGEELCCECPETSDMAFRDVRLSQEAQTWSVTLAGSTKNACLKVGPVKVSPNLDYNGVFTVMWNDDLSIVTVLFEGHVETYPAFELYAALDDQPPVAVFQLPVEPGTTPTNLVGPPTRAVTEQVRLNR